MVALAQEEARTLRHDYIGTEHLLLGLLREDQGLAARVLVNLGMQVERVRGQIVRIVGAGEEVPSGQIPFTPRAKQVLELALREALSLGHNYIGPEHILLALGRENESVGTRIMRDFDADPEAVRHAVMYALSGSDALPVAGGRMYGPGPRVGAGPRVIRSGGSRATLDWQRASILWRPEGLELRVPLHLDEGAMATFAADEVWSSAPLLGMRREIWNGWLGLASISLLEDVEPVELRRVLDEAAKRALNVSGRERGRVEDFLLRLRDG